MCLPRGNTGEWTGRPITLQIDHINGDWLDKRLGNLRFLCPNCHATTDTYCGRNRNRNRNRNGRLEPANTAKVPPQLRMTVFLERAKP